MDFLQLLGAIGAVASIVSLALPSQSKAQRLLHVIYGLAIVVFASLAVHYWDQAQRIHKVEHGATTLVESQNYTSEGFVLAALAFLEKNRDLYPDAYRRAQELCKASDCLGPQYGVPSHDSLEHAFNLNNAAGALRGLLRGIGTLEGSS